MRPLRLIIVDDEPLARSRMRDVLSDLRPQCPHELLAECASGREAIAVINRLAPDVVLLDVQMPGMTGIELARHLAALKSPPLVVFATAFDDYALQAFEVHAIDYLLKPVRAERLRDCLQRAAGRLNERADRATVENEAQAHRPDEGAQWAALAKQAGVRRRCLSVTERGSVLLVPIEDVLYFRAELKYTTIRTVEREYLSEESLTSLEDEFGDRFIRVHRNALVAREAIAGTTRSTEAAESDNGEHGWRVLLRGVHETLPVSRRQWPLLKSLLRG